MEEHILSKIVKVEEDIQKKIAAEKKKAADLIEQAKEEAAFSIRNEEARLTDSCNSAMEEARKRAEEKAAAVLQEARSQTEIIVGLTDDVLTEIIAEHIRSIVPH